MSQVYKKTDQEALIKALDVLLLAVTGIEILTGSRDVTGVFIKGASTSEQEKSNNPKPFPQVGATYKKRTTCYLETGEDREVIETYRLNAESRWELVDVKISDTPPT